jgi:ankyrin repeat protein
MEDTILHYAAFKRNKELIKYLLKKGAFVDRKNQVFPFTLISKRNLLPKDVTDDPDIKNLLS